MKDIVPLKAHRSAVSTLRTIASAEKFSGVFLRAAEYEAGGLKDLSDDIACSDKLWEEFGESISLYLRIYVLTYFTAGYLLSSNLAVGTRAQYLSCMFNIAKRRYSFRSFKVTTGYCQYYTLVLLMRCRREMVV